ncbi:hypothetical protein GKQ23_10760 [Erwinia sp. E602]|uniref:hypothetical protein n=1 Tax=Erwinia sp. E602 TaxID=2675378 RepID=UPI001BA85F19|nr:hypothetical protein [Erwinia sp. E602]QUG75436.1 hypothetical protein GKQ23_10760 [Erwinia sp. E602]
MSNLPAGKVIIEVVRSQSGGFSLCIGDNSGGHRLCGGKVGGMETVHTFIVDAKELIEQAADYGKVQP